MILLQLLLNLVPDFARALISGRKVDIASLAGQIAGVAAKAAFEAGQPITADDLASWKADADLRARVLAQ
jgi:hypothetical protein